MASATVTDRSLRSPRSSTAAAAGSLLSPERGELVDRRQRRVEYLRVSLTDRCNYRCTYCRPAKGDGGDLANAADVLSPTDLVRLVACFVRLGVRRVRLTGGEPTLRRDLVEVVRALRQLSGLDELSLSTNGHRLAELAGPLRSAGVDRLNVSVDSLDAERFRTVTRGGDLGRVVAGLEVARGLGFESIKINTVAIRGFNDGEIADLCQFAWQRGFLPRFIEQMPMADGALFVPGAFMSAEEIRRAVGAAFPRASLIRDDAPAPGAGPARYVRVTDGGTSRVLGSFGLISPLTEHFCDTCNRVRLSAAGHLHTCLAHDDVTDLRAALASGGEAAVDRAIQDALSVKRDGHQFGLIGIGGPRKSMVQIGG